MTDPQIINTALEVLGQEDRTQLTVRGHTTQNELLQVWEDSGTCTLIGKNHSDLSTTSRRS